MAGTLDGKRAIVTGGGQGIGRGIALALAAEGATASSTRARRRPPICSGTRSRAIDLREAQEG